MLDQIYIVPQNASEVLGDLAAFAEEVGCTDPLGRLTLATASLESMRVDSLPALQQFLDDYAANVLIRYELAAVMQAYQYAVRSQVRELIALDQQLSHVRALQGFARASGNVGKTQLRRLRPLRSERVVQRYLKSVDAGEANAWHTIVFGLVVALYSLPPRQGLIHFAHQTLGGFAHAAAPRFSMGSAETDQLLSGYTRLVASAVDALVDGQGLCLVEAGGRI